MKVYGLWEGWRDERLTCDCGWTGRGDESAELGSLNSLTGSRHGCPSCGWILFLTHGATFEETAIAFKRGMPGARIEYEMRLALRRHELEHIDDRLTHAAQLPVLSGQVDAHLGLDQAPDTGGYPRALFNLVLELNGVVVHTEPMLQRVTEMIDRIGSVLVATYQERLGRLVISTRLGSEVASTATGWCVSEVD